MEDEKDNALVTIILAILIVTGTVAFVAFIGSFDQAVSSIHEYNGR